MNPQLVLLFAMTLALYAIAYKMFHPTATLTPQVATVPITQLESKHRSTRDVIYIDRAWRGSGVAIHEAERRGYKFSQRDGDLITYVRNGA